MSKDTVTCAKATEQILLLTVLYRGLPEVQDSFWKMNSMFEGGTFLFLIVLHSTSSLTIRKNKKFIRAKLQKRYISLLIGTPASKKKNRHPFFFFGYPIIFSNTREQTNFNQIKIMSQNI